MRNLKRALSLAVSTVMLVGMMAVGTSAASYADVTSEHNEEAIGVMQAVSVMVGDENGNFNPDKNVTRAEMAVVMANLLDLQVEDFVGASIPFTDVPEWARAYVAACYADGITGGISATEYGSNNSVTATQAALMMMKALGYFQYAQDFGTDWQVATIKQASKIELFDGIDSARNAAMTRNEVAQIALNALEATMVEPDGTPGSVTTPDGTIVNLGSVTYNDRTSTNSKYAAINDDEGNNGRYTMELGEDLFDGDLEKNSNGHDDFYRPAHVWEYKGEEIGAYSDSADEVYVVEDTGLNVNDILTDSDYMNYKASEVEDAEVYINADDTARLTTNLSRGDVVEAFEDSNGNVETVVVRNYQIAVIDSIDTDLSATDERNGASVELTLKDLDDKDVGSGTYYDDYDDADVVLAGYNGDYTEGTVLAVALDGDVILDSYIADTVSGNINGFRASSITVDGTRYYYAGADKSTDTVSYDFDEEYDVYLTAEGYVIGVDGATGISLDDVYYVVGAYSGSGSYGRNNYYVQAVTLADGTVEEIELDKDDAGALESVKETVDAAEGDGFVAVGGLYTFDDGVAEEYNDASDDYTVVLKADLADDLAVDDNRVVVNTNSRYYLDSNTQFLAVDKSADDIEVGTAVGGMSADSADKDGKVYVIADGRDAVYVVLVNFGATTASDDVVYVADDSYDVVGSKQYAGEIWFMETGDSEDVVLNAREGVGFYKVKDIDEDDVYDLDATAPALGSGDVDSDSEGYIREVTLPKGADEDSVIYRDALTLNTDTADFDDVSMANAVVIDSREDVNNCLYTRDINSVSRLIAALEEGDVKVDIYVIDGEITFVAVTDSARTSGGSIGGGDKVGTAIEGVNTASDSVNSDTALKNQRDGAYIFAEGSSLSGVDDIRGGIENNMFFKFVTEGNSYATLVIYDDDGDKVYEEGYSFTGAGGHFFYVQVLGEDLLNAGSGDMATKPLTVGTYRYEIFSGNNTLLTGEFDITAE